MDVRITKVGFPFFSHRSVYTVWVKGKRQTPDKGWTLLSFKETEIEIAIPSSSQSTSS